MEMEAREQIVDAVWKIRISQNEPPTVHQMPGSHRFICGFLYEFLYCLLPSRRTHFGCAVADIIHPLPFWKRFEHTFRENNKIRVI